MGMTQKFRRQLRSAVMQLVMCLDEEDRRGIAVEILTVSAPTLPINHQDLPEVTGSHSGAELGADLGANGQLTLGANGQLTQGANGQLTQVQKGGYGGDFLQFWTAFPRRVGKQEAYSIWLKLKPDKELLDRILEAVRQQKTWGQWTRDEGRFIPYPKTWLNQGRWADEPTDEPGSNGLVAPQVTRTDMSGLRRFVAKGQLGAAR